MRPFWRVEMLGTLQARSDDLVVSRFRTRRVGMLLAYLTYFSGKSHDRAEIGEILWPEGDPEKTSVNLRQALASLRRHIEPPPLPPGSILQSKNWKLSIAPGMVETDTAQFERALTDAQKGTDPAARRLALEHAVALYRGELLPGFDAEWVSRERSRLEDLHAHALRMLAKSAQSEGHHGQAIDALHRALAHEPYNEGLYADLMRLLLDSGQALRALEQYREAQRRLTDELGMEPDEPLRALAREAKRRLPEDTPAVTRAAVSAEHPSSAVRLPIQLTRLFGRQIETAALTDQFTQSEAGFVTVLGPAGVGKTTHAVATARRLAEEHGWQVGFVPMADYADASMVLAGVADAFRANREHPSNVLERIRAAMTAGPSLVVLDNAEHILEGLAPVVATLRSEIPELRLLVTSRQSLKVADEREVVLNLLEVPREDDQLERLSQFPSVALFVDRARMIQPDFGLTARNARAVAEICVRLDGLPLAIEIAAGLSGAFTPTQMLGHLRHRLDILRTRRRDAPVRHRSLNVALDYSYDTLSESQKRFFTRLSIFSGGFTLAAASEVALDGSEEGRTLQAILELQERSLVLSEASDDDAAPRFRLLETFREYGSGRLSDADRLENGNRHSSHYLSSLPEAAGALRAADLRRFRLGVLRDLGNYWAATNHLIGQNRLNDAVRILANTTQFGHWGKPRKAEFDVLCDLDPARLSTKSQALVARMIGQYQRAANIDGADATLQRSVTLARATGDPVILVPCLVSLAALLTTQQKFENALEIYAEIRTYEGRSGVDQAVSDAYNGLGTCQWMLGQLDEAETAFRRGLLFSREEPGEEANWLARYNIARVSIDQGRYEAAVSFAGDAIRIARRLEDAFGISMGVLLLSMYRWKTGDLEGAIISSQEAMALRHNMGLVSWFAQSVQFHAILLADRGEAERAATLLAAAQRHLTNRRDPEIEITLDKIRSGLSPVEFSRAQERGLTMDLDEAYEIAR
jgi:predicted ATPase/DNA-binding SARP family transcriptional activator